jgi:hypothetical protein
MKTPGLLSVLALALMPVVDSPAQDPPRSGIYRIQSGTYEELGGFTGVMNFKLPYPWQAFVSLQITPAGKANMSFLSQNQQSTFYIQLTNGVVSGDTIRFQYWTARPFPINSDPATFVDYRVTNAAGRLWINGALQAPFVCCDFPYYFTHTNLAAVFVPTLTLSVSHEVRLNWPSASNQVYQVQWLSDLTGSNWSNLGEAQPGNGGTNGVADIWDAKQPQKFYRLLISP